MPLSPWGHVDSSANLVSIGGCGSASHSFEPAENIGEVLHVLLQERMLDDPGIDGHVGYRVVTGDVPSIRQLRIQHSQEPCSVSA